MKKLLLLFLAGFFLNSSSFCQTLDPGDLRAHGLGSYGLQWKDPGAGLGIEVFFIENFALMPSFTNFFVPVGNRSNFSMDLRYYVSDGPSQLYVMTGYSQTWENTQPGLPGVRRSFKGANVGIGAYIGLLEWVGLSTEFRFQSQYLREVGFRFGLAFPL